QGLADGAELAGGAAIIETNAVLQDGGRQHVAAVQGRNLPVGNAVGGAAAVEIRHARHFHLTDLQAFTEDQRQAAISAGLSLIRRA
nr:hypothetical protein [Tanacetum cinerariifolium]